MIIRLNKSLLIVFVLLINNLSYSQSLDSLQLKKFYKEIDSIEYSSYDFNKLKQHINSNSQALKLISENAAKGSKSHIELLEFLELSFDEAKVKYGEKNVKSLNETSVNYEEAIVSAVTPKSSPPKPITSKKDIQRKKPGLLKTLFHKFKSIFGIIKQTF